MAVKGRHPEKAEAMREMIERVSKSSPHAEYCARARNSGMDALEERIRGAVSREATGNVYPFEHRFSNCRCLILLERANNIAMLNARRVCSVAEAKRKETWVISRSKPKYNDQGK